MELQLDFKNPSAVSSSITRNTLKVTVWNVNLFRRQSDGFPIAETTLETTTTLQSEMSRLISYADAEKVLAIGSTLVLAGNSALLASSIKQFFTGYGMNGILS